MPGPDADLWAALAAAGTVGALFGTPVAAALILSEALAARPAPGALWDKLFAPLIAGGGRRADDVLIAHPTFDLALPASSDHRMVAICLAALVVSSLGALVGMAAVRAFPYVHGAFERLRHPVLTLTAGGTRAGAARGAGRASDALQGARRGEELAADPTAGRPGSSR